MADLRLHLDADALARRFAAMAGSLEGFVPFLRAAGRHLLDSLEHRFATESGPDGRKWPQSLAARCEGRQTLTKTGRLRRSFRTRIGPNGLTLGTTVPYAPTHQFGAVIHANTSAGLRFRICSSGPLYHKQSVRIPPRPFLGIDDDDRHALAAMFSNHVAAALGRADGRERPPVLPFAGGPLP